MVRSHQTEVAHRVEQRHAFVIIFMRAVHSRHSVPVLPAELAARNRSAQSLSRSALSLLDRTMASAN
jgi:hypothetical protein